MNDTSKRTSPDFQTRLNEFLHEFSKENDLSQLSAESDTYKQLCQMAADKWHLDNSTMRAISQEEMLYLLEHCPFLQIVERGVHSEPFESVKIIEAQSGWLIHNYGNAIASSPGRFMLGGGPFHIGSQAGSDDEDEGGEGGAMINWGHGTIYKQAFDTAFEMVQLAKLQDWEGISIIDGHPMMLRAAWIAATVESGLVIAGFRPTDADQKIRDRYMMGADELQVVIQQMKAQQKEAATSKPLQKSSSIKSKRPSLGKDQPNN